MKRKSGDGDRYGRKNEAGLRAAGARGPFRIEREVGIEVRLHTIEVALYALRRAGGPLDLMEHKVHLSVAVQAAGRVRVHHVPEKAGAFRDQQGMVGREQGPGHHGFYRRSASGGCGTDRREQARGDFLRAGCASRREWTSASRGRGASPVRGSCNTPLKSVPAAQVCR